MIHTPREQRSRLSHSISNEEAGLHIPLKLDGVISYFATRKPTQEELQDPDATTHVVMTRDEEWDPSDPSPGRSEDAIRMKYTEDPQTIAAIELIRGINCTRERVQRMRESRIDAIRTRPRESSLKPKELATKWRIGIETARRTLNATTQLAVRDLVSVTGDRRLKPTAYQLRFRRLRVEMYCDVMIGKTKSLRGNSCAVVFATTFHWIRVYPIPKRKDAHIALKSLFKDFGVPHTLIPDNARELTGGEIKVTADKAQCSIRPVEAYTPNQNVAETAIREVKRAYRRHMIGNHTPGPLWDYCIQYVTELRTHTALPMHSLQGQTPMALLTGDSPDISHICSFGWYSYVWFLSPPRLGENFENKFLGRYLGPSFDVGDVLCSHVINSKGRVVSRTSVIPISKAELESEGMQRAVKEFEEELRRKLEGPTRDSDEDIHSVPVHRRIDEHDDHFEHYEDDDASDLQAPLKEDDDLDHDAYDKYILSRVIIPTGDAIQHGTVRRRKRDERGNLIGQSNPNPILDTSIYEVEFDDGRTEAFAANVIAESIYAEVDDEGQDKLLLDEIVDHRKTADAVAADDAVVVIRGQDQGMAVACPVARRVYHMGKTKRFERVRPCDGG